jgi:transposase
MATEEVSMSGKRYTDEFKIEAVKQVTERGHSVTEVAQRLGITTHSLYTWKTKFGKPDVVQQTEVNQSAEVRRLKAELKRVTEERDILKNIQRGAPLPKGQKLQGSGYTGNAEGSGRLLFGDLSR